MLHGDTTMILDEYLSYIQEQQISNIIKNKYKVMNHLTFPENLSSIKSKGIIPRKKYSKYGNPPILKAVYLYHNSASSVIKDFKKTFGDKRIINIKINVSKLDPNLFYADEDYYRYPYKRKIKSENQMKMDALKCLMERGTTAYKGIIDSKYFLDIREVT